MSRNDERLMARYLAEANGDVRLVNRAIQLAYKKHRLSPSPDLIIKCIKQLQKAKASSPQEGLMASI